MSAQTSMLHVRVNDSIKNEAAEKLEDVGLTLSDAVRILLTRIAREGGMPPGLIADNTSYDAWFKAKVHEALSDNSPTVPHEQVMDDIQNLIDRKRANVAR
ncbi:MAG: type II toxin-antitoxin system RelB/DinJ family antitoxin [Deltaproteobacteria bacterium]|nr:type II toxin-antitoxin system RelB/DinJ family antitoxin [Deltaproteobacteria bacterium]